MLRTPNPSPNLHQHQHLHSNSQPHSKLHSHNHHHHHHHHHNHPNSISTPSSLPSSPLNAPQKPSIFPSYTAISRNLQKEQQRPYREKIQHVNEKIQQLKDKINVNAEHREMAKKLIADFKKECIEDREKTKPCHLEFPELKIVPKPKFSKFADSVNQYLSDSDEDQRDDYEMRLKFRKKALQREIQEQHEKTTSKDYQPKQQIFYRNMYVQQTTNIRDSSGKQNKDMQARCMHLQQNRKKLLQGYLPYVEGLCHTNIVKWRVLNA